MSGNPGGKGIHIGYNLYIDYIDKKPDYIEYSTNSYASQSEYN